MQHPHDDEVTVLYSENREALLRYAYRYMNDWEWASDVLQTSMLKFIRMFDRLSRLTHQQKTGYLFTVVKNTAHSENLKNKSASFLPQKSGFPLFQKKTLKILLWAT